MTVSQRSDDIRTISKRLEDFHAASYFAPQLVGALRATGLVHASDMYLASRSAPLGAVTGEAVAAIFYSFGMAFVARSLPKAWEIASPEQVHTARAAGARDMARDARAGVVDAHEYESAERVDELAVGLTTALEPVIAAMEDTYRPLSAATRRAFADTPAAADEPVFALWIAATHVREYRGDSHGAALAAAGVTGEVATVLHSLDGGPFPPAVARKVHGWTEGEWADTVAQLRKRELITGDEDDAARLTDAGHVLRADVEEATDAAVAGSWAVLDDDALHALAESAKLGSKLGRAVQTAG